MKGSKQAVIIDDDPLVRNLLKTILKNLGYETQTYESPLEVPCIANPQAASCFNTDSPPELLITDIKMPGMTGIEFLLNITRKECKIKKMAIMSGYWDENYSKRAIELGCKRFEKPFQVEDIKSWVEEE